MDILMLAQALNYKQWADRRTIDAVKKIHEIEKRSTVDFARQQINHMVRVEENFRARLLRETEPHSSTNTENVPELLELDRRLTIVSSWLAAYIAELSVAQLNERLHFQFVDGKQGSMTRQEIIFHIVNHGTYHRGAIGHALDIAQANRPADTYTVFIHAIEPQRRAV